MDEIQNLNYIPLLFFCLTTNRVRKGNTRINSEENIHQRIITGGDIEGDGVRQCRLIVSSCEKRKKNLDKPWWTLDGLLRLLWWWTVDDGLGRWGSCDGMCRRAVLDDRNGRRNDDPVENTRGSLRNM